MRILLVDTTMGGDVIGGAQTFLVHLLTRLANYGHDLNLLTASVPNKFLGETVFSAQMAVHADLWRRTDLVDDINPRIGKWVNDLRPDVFVVSVSPDIGWTVLPLLDPSIATLTIGHNDENTFYAPVKHYSRFLTRAIGVSDEICRKYVDECGMPAERVEWIPYGVVTDDREPVTAGAGPIRLIYVGRVENTQKRIADVVAIIKTLSEAGVDFEFDLVGDGEEMPNVRSALAGEVAAGNVRLHGWLNSAKVIERMRAAEVFVLASEYEGFCISLTEAIANGCCPIVSDIRSGNKQLVEDGVGGFVVPVGDVEGFVGRIKALADDRSRLREIRIAAWTTGREYSIDRMVANYIACFERAIKDANAYPRTPESGFPLMESCRSKYPLWLRRLKAKIIKG